MRIADGNSAGARAPQIECVSVMPGVTVRQGLSPAASPEYTLDSGWTD